MKYEEFEKRVQGLGYYMTMDINKSKYAGYSRVTFRQLNAANGFGYKDKYIDTTYLSGYSKHLGELTDKREIKKHLVTVADDIFKELERRTLELNAFIPIAKAVIDSGLMHQNDTLVEVGEGSIHFPSGYYYEGRIKIDIFTRTIDVDVRVNASALLHSSASIADMEREIEKMKELRKKIVKRLTTPLQGYMILLGGNLHEVDEHTAEKTVKAVCHTCGSEDVLADAYAEWNKEKQCYEVASIFDKGAYCNKCDGETTIDMVGGEK